MRRVSRLKIGGKYLVSTEMSASPMTEAGSAFPWGEDNRKVPVEVEEEHKHFYTCTVTPHHAKFCSFGISKPYRVTIAKWELDTQIFKAWEEEDEVIGHEN